LWNCSIPITNTKGSYLYPGSNTTPSRPRLQHLLSNGVISISHPSSIHPFFIFKPRHHAFPNASSFQAWNSSSAKLWRTPDRRPLYRMLWGKPLAELCSSTKLDPQVSLFPVPIFGVNTFRARSSPTSTRVKPQPAPAILSQEFVHTTLSITHHTRKRPSTGPQTLQSSVLHVNALVLGSFGVVFTSCLDLWQASWSSHKVPDELIPKVSFLMLISYVNNKLQKPHASVNLLQH
jgi:hypothetical protein